MRHPLLDPPVLLEIERAAAAHCGRTWVRLAFTDCGDRAAHPCGIFHGRPISVFVKLGAGATGHGQLAAELAGLDLLARRARVLVPARIADGLVQVEAGTLLLTEALPELPARSRADFQSIGRALAALHRVTGERPGLSLFNGFFGPLPQDNRPVEAGGWAAFYAQRRVIPLLRTAVDSGNLPPGLAARVDRVIRRLPDLCGPEPRPCLLHGDAQQNNFVSTASGAVVIDAAPYFGHPEVDLAMVDYFEPVPPDLLDAYRDDMTLDPGFAGRRELWRIFGYLAVIAVDGHQPFGHQFLGRLDLALVRYE